MMYRVFVHMECIMQNEFAPWLKQLFRVKSEVTFDYLTSSSIKLIKE